MDNNNIPLDIIFDILLRLPIKSIGRSKCVSKSWRSLISDSQFVKKHLHRSISSITDDDDNTRIIVSDFTKTMLTNPSMVEHMDFDDALCKMVGSGLTTIVGSCHGLLAILVHDGYHNNIFVCNPCTRDVRELPKLNYTAKNSYPSFDGIGYDSSTDDYKVLISANVFSFKSNSWKTLTHTPCEYDSLYENFGVFFDGCIHWIVMRNTEAVILSFDLDTEQYLESPQLQLPQEPNRLTYQRLFVMGTFLSVFLDDRLNEDKHEVWVMKKHGVESAWTKSFVVVYGRHEYYVRPVCLLKSGELLLHADYFLLVLYNPMDGTTRVNFPGDFVFFNVYGYLESLVSPIKIG